MNIQSNEIKSFKLLQMIYDAKIISGKYQDEEKETILNEFRKAEKIGVKGLFTITELADGSKILTETLPNVFPNSDIVEITYAPSFNYNNSKFLINKSLLSNIHESLARLPRGNFLNMVQI